MQNMNVVIIKYNAGNIQSVDFALQRLGVKAEVTDNFDSIKSADKVIFPGVGEASSAMQYLRTKNLDKLIPELKQPVLGICLGMQLMCQSSEEGGTRGLGIFPAKVKKFIPKGETKVPHTGWNRVAEAQQGLFSCINNEYMYFVHSYYVPKAPYTKLTCTYDIPFSAAIQNQNFYGVQFHPEKSGEAGAEFLTKFIRL